MPVHIIKFVIYCRYNGSLGDFTLNNKEIADQIMRKFLIGIQLRDIEWPEDALDLRDILSVRDLRGTTGSIGCDIEQHANLAFSANTTHLDFSFRDLVDCQILQYPDRKIRSWISKSEMEFISQMFVSLLGRNRDEFFVSRHVTFVESICYQGEVFRADKQTNITCNVIRAKWLSSTFPLQVNTAEPFQRAGFVNSIVVVSVNVAGLKKYFPLLKIGWLNIHEQPYHFGNHIQMYYSHECIFGSYSYMPIQRVLCKCAISKRKHDNITVTVVMPISGQWALCS